MPDPDNYTKEECEHGIDVAYQLMDIRRRLAEFYPEAEIEEWLRSPHPQLNNAAPIQFIERLETGAFL